MTTTEHESDLQFYLKSAVLDFEDVEDDDPEVNRIEFKTLNQGDLYLYPRTEIQQSKKINGLPGKSDKNVPYKVSGLPEKLQNLVKAVNKERDYYVKLTTSAQRVDYDDGGRVYRVYDNMINSDSFSVHKEEKEEETDEKSTAEEFAEKEMEASNSEEEVIFGEEDEQ